MGDIVKLVSSQDAPRKNPCATCRHFHPDTKNYGWNHSGWWPFWKRTGPSADALKFAICSAMGGYFARTARMECDGNYWEPDRSE